MQPDAFADMVVHTVKAALGTALGPVLERVAAAEARIAMLPAAEKTLTDLRDRVVAVETKAVMQAPEPILPDLGPAFERLAAIEARLSTLGDLRDRVVAVETKASVPQQDAAIGELREKISAFSEWRSVVTQLPIQVSALSDMVTKELVDLRSRLRTVETQETPQPLSVDLGPMSERVAAAEARLSTLGDLRDRVVAVETKSALPALPDPATGDLSDRVMLLEATQPMTSEKAMLMLKAALDPAVVSIVAEISAVRERLAVVETRGPVPGPPGTDGTDGKDGTDGMGWDDLLVTHDGERSFTFKMMRGDRVKDFGNFTIPVQIYRGIYTEGRTYEPGDTVTYARSLWHCLKTTVLKPDSVKLDSMTGKPIGGQGKDFWKMAVKGGQDGKDGLNAHTTPVVSVGRPA